jgi:hypothetical protein
MQRPRGKNSPRAVNVLTDAALVCWVNMSVTLIFSAVGARPSTSRLRVRFSQALTEKGEQKE